MRLASFVISFCLHSGFVLLVLFWPSPLPPKLEAQPISVSLVDGLPGGNRTPSPILGPQGAPAQAPRLPAEPSKAPPAPASVEPPPAAVPVPVQETPPKLEIPKLVPKPAPEPDAALLADKKTEEPQKPDTSKEEGKKKEEPKKAEAPKPAPPKRTPAEEALAKLRDAAKPTLGEMRVKPNAVAQALAAARKQSSGQDGGGGGEGEGGGGIADIYGAQIVMAVQPNWHWPALAKGDLSVALYLRIDATGRVLDVRVEESSGNALFDSSAVAAVRRTQVLPPPPSPAYHKIVLPFFPMR